MKSLIDKPREIILKKDVLATLTNEKDRDKYLRESTYIPIKLTGVKNIMIDIFYNAADSFPDSLEINSYAQKGSHGSCPYQKDSLRHNILNNNIAHIRILDVSSNGFFTGVMEGFAFDSEDLTQDFSFFVDIKFKYVYQVHAGRHYEELVTPDGQCNHEEGDSFPDAHGNEITVMEINHDTGIVLCSATGYLSSN